MPLNAIRSESRLPLELRLVICRVNRHFVFTQWWETASQNGQAIQVRLKDLELNIYTNGLWVQMKSHLTDSLFNFQNLNPRSIALVFFFLSLYEWRKGETYSIMNRSCWILKSTVTELIYNFLSILGATVGTPESVW